MYNAPISFYLLSIDNNETFAIIMGKIDDDSLLKICKMTSVVGMEKNKYYGNIFYSIMSNNNNTENQAILVNRLAKYPKDLIEILGDIGDIYLDKRKDELKKVLQATYKLCNNEEVREYIKSIGSKYGIMLALPGQTKQQ